MLLNLFKKSNKEYISLDIGSQNTKMALLSSKGVISKFIIEPTPEKVFDSGVILDVEGLSKFLMACIGKLDITNDTEVITGVSGKGIITKKIDIPSMEENLIAEHLPFEAEQYLPYEIDEMDLDYEILRDIETNISTETPVLLVAVLKNIVHEYNELFEKSYLKCNILDTNVFALFNIFEKNYDLDETENYFLIDIGLNTTNLVVVIKNQVVFTRSLPVGGSFYTNELEKRLSLSYAEAEELKKSASEDKEHPENVSSTIQETIGPLFCDEIFSGYEFYLSFFPKNKASQVYVTGGGSQCLGLIDALNKKFEVPVHQFNPFQGIELSPDLKFEEEKLLPFGSIVAGLSLRVL